MAKSKWLEHVRKTWKANGGSYRDAMVAAKKTYRKGSGSAAAEPVKKKPKKRRRRVVK